MCVTDRHDMTLAVKVALNPNSTNQPTIILKAVAHDKINVTEISKFVLKRVENIVGKGENAGYQHFLLLAQCFQVFFSMSLKVAIVW